MFLQALTAIAALVTAIAAAAAAIAAVKGLNVWRNQLIGQTDHDLARRLLIAVNLHLSAIEKSRHPYLPAHEMSSISDEARDIDNATRTYRQTLRVREQRVDVIYAARSEVRSLLIEADAVWGDQTSGKWEDMRKLEEEYLMALDEDLRLSDPSEGGVERPKETVDEFSGRRKIAYGLANDAFGTRLSASLRPLEEFLRGKLRVSR